MNKQKLTEENVEVYKKFCFRCNVAKNRTNAQRRQSTLTNGHENLNQTSKTNSPFQISNLNLACNKIQF